MLKINENKKIMTLCIIHDKEQDRVLLGMKKRGFGVGRWNGFGGKVNTGETIEEAAIREIREEAGIEVNNMIKIGVLEFTWEQKDEVLETHIFKVDNFINVPVESEEMRPQWFKVEDIPFHQMWSDDHYWVPLFLDDKKFRGRFKFDEFDVILEKELIID